MRKLTQKECETTSGSVLMYRITPEGNREVEGFPIASAVNQTPVLDGTTHKKIDSLDIGAAVGAAVGALVGGFMAGGPVGFGFALGSIVIAAGVNGLIKMF